MREFLLKKPKKLTLLIKLSAPLVLIIAISTLLVQILLTATLVLVTPDFLETAFLAPILTSAPVLTTALLTLNVATLR